MTDPHLAISERDFQAQVVQLSELCGWMVYHTYDSRRSNAGFPDLVLVRPPQVVFAELKSQKGRVRPQQEVWLSALGASDKVTVALWRPSDWDDLERILR